MHFNRLKLYKGRGLYTVGSCSKQKIELLQRWITNPSALERAFRNGSNEILTDPMDCGSTITQKLLKTLSYILHVGSGVIERENTSLNKIVLFDMFNFRPIIMIVNDDSSVNPLGV